MNYTPQFNFNIKVVFQKPYHMEKRILY